ncbi:hypothetical protein B0H13DRAFT_2665643, partial [Mycena leptocephala]
MALTIRQASETSSGAAPHAYPERCTIIPRVFSLPTPVRQGRWLSWRPEVKDMLLWFISVPGLWQGLLTVSFMLVGQTGSLLVRAALLSIISHEFLIT